MKIDLLILQVAILLLPGLIWAHLDARYVLKTKPSDVEFALRAFLFGLSSYAVTLLLYTFLGWRFVFVDVSDAATRQVVTADIGSEVLCATVVGLFLSILWIYSATYKWLTRFLQIIKATKKYGDEDVWDYTFNSPNPAVEYVHFRDFDKSIVYAGWVNTFSETEKIRELVLRDVQVYDFDGNMLFEIPLIYIARKPENMDIEFPYNGQERG